MELLYLLKQLHTSVEIHENEDNADLVPPYVSGCHMQCWCAFSLYWKIICLFLIIN